MPQQKVAHCIPRVLRCLSCLDKVDVKEGRARQAPGCGGVVWAWVGKGEEGGGEGRGRAGSGRQAAGPAAAAVLYECEPGAAGGSRGQPGAGAPAASKSDSPAIGVGSDSARVEWLCAAHWARLYSHHRPISVHSSKLKVIGSNLWNKCISKVYFQSRNSTADNVNINL